MEIEITQADVDTAIQHMGHPQYFRKSPIATAIKRMSPRATTVSTWPAFDGHGRVVAVKAIITPFEGSTIKAELPDHDIISAWLSEAKLPVEFRREIMEGFLEHGWDCVTHPQKKAIAREAWLKGPDRETLLAHRRAWCRGFLGLFVCIPD